MFGSHIRVQINTQFSELMNKRYAINYRLKGRNIVWFPTHISVVKWDTCLHHKKVTMNCMGAYIGDDGEVKTITNSEKPHLYEYMYVGLNGDCYFDCKEITEVDPKLEEFIKEFQSEFTLEIAEKSLFKSIKPLSYNRLSKDYNKFSRSRIAKHLVSARNHFRNKGGDFI